MDLEKVQAFIPLAAVWILLHAAVILCAFTITAYRLKGTPKMDPAGALIGSVALLYLAPQQSNGVMMAVHLIIAVFAAFSGGIWSLQAMRAAWPYARR